MKKLIAVIVLIVIVAALLPFLNGIFLERTLRKAVDDANAGTLGTNTLSEDNDCPDGLTLAHEAGHFLSAGALPHTANGIMGACGAPNYDRVRKAEADAVNP